jgi:hypothetical protein
MSFATDALVVDQLTADARIELHHVAKLSLAISGGVSRAFGLSCKRLLFFKDPASTEIYTVAPDIGAFTAGHFQAAAVDDMAQMMQRRSDLGVSHVKVVALQNMHYIGECIDGMAMQMRTVAPARLRHAQITSLTI